MINKLHCHIRVNDNRDMVTMEEYLFERIWCLEREVKRLNREKEELQQAFDQALEVINGHAARLTRIEHA